MAVPWYQVSSLGFTLPVSSFPFYKPLVFSSINLSKSFFVDIFGICTSRGDEHSDFMKKRSCLLYVLKHPEWSKVGGEVGNIAEKNMDRCRGKREPGNRGTGLTREERRLPVCSLRSCADDTVRLWVKARSGQLAKWLYLARAVAQRVADAVGSFILSFRVNPWYTRSFGN